MKIGFKVSIVQALNIRISIGSAWIKIYEAAFSNGADFELSVKIDSLSLFLSFSQTMYTLFNQGARAIFGVKLIPR